MTVTRDFTHRFPVFSLHIYSYSQDEKVTHTKCSINNYITSHACAIFTV